MKNQGKTDKQVRDSEVAAGIAIVGIVWIIGYLIIFGQKNQFKNSLQHTHNNLYVYTIMKQSKWYTIQVTPLDEVRSPYNFKIETSNLEKTMDKYTRDKEGTITALWEIVRR